MSLFVTENYLFPQVVSVAAFTVNNLSENALFNHIHNRHLCLSVAAVFKEHKGRFCSLIRTNKLPTVVNGICSANLHSNGYSLLHGIKGYRKM